MIRVDHRPFKKAMYELIENTDPLQKKWIVVFEARVVELVREHRLSVTPKEYAPALVHLLSANNKARAHKLVDCLGDSGWTWAAAYTLGILRILAWTTALALFVVFVVFIYDSCRN